MPFDDLPSPLTPTPTRCADPAPSGRPWPPPARPRPRPAVPRPWPRGVAPLSLLRALAATMARLARAMTRERAARRSIAHLRRLDGPMLRDIGIEDRSRIEALVRRGGF
ncbi:MAG: DUF1127 domain-containing protein [Pseudomonadota bacterium]|nr:DUF1127 domain-containing protein [Pseudomonadota bacterium]